MKLKHETITTIMLFVSGLLAIATIVIALFMLSVLSGCGGTEPDPDPIDEPGYCTEAGAYICQLELVWNNCPSGMLKPKVAVPITVDWYKCGGETKQAEFYHTELQRWGYCTEDWAWIDKPTMSGACKMYWAYTVSQSCPASMRNDGLCSCYYNVKAQCHQ